MAETTKIQWTHHTFNPWVGCTKVSPGCANCYAEVDTPSRVFGVKWGKGNQRHRTSEANWKKPLTYNRKAAKAGTRSRIFCASLCDVFDSEVPQFWRDDLWALIEKCSHLDWQLLTKRLNVMGLDELLGMVPELWRHQFPPNVWIGHSICTQAEADAVIPELLKINAPVRFVSLEPLLERVSIAHASGLEWAIIGGESGTKAREFQAEWGTQLLSECRALGIKPFMKQVGDRPVGAGDIHAKKGGDMSEWHPSLAVREFPLSA